MSLLHPPSLSTMRNWRVLNQLEEVLPINSFIIALTVILIIFVMSPTSLSRLTDKGDPVNDPVNPIAEQLLDAIRNDSAISYEALADSRKAIQESRND